MSAWFYRLAEPCGLARVAMISDDLIDISAMQWQWQWRGLIPDLIHKTRILNDIKRELYHASHTVDETVRDDRSIRNRTVQGVTWGKAAGNFIMHTLMRMLGGTFEDPLTLPPQFSFILAKVMRALPCWLGRVSLEMNGAQCRIMQRTNPLMDAVDKLPQLWKCPWAVGFIPTGFLDVWNVSAWDRVTLAIYTGVCDGVRLHNRNDIHLTQYGEVSRTLIDDPWSTVSLEHRRGWMH